MNFITYTCRAYPNKAQTSLIDLTFKMCKIMYNTLLKIVLDNYSSFINTVNICLNNNENIDEEEFAKSHKLPTMKALKMVNSEYKKVDSLALCSEYKNLVRGMELFYRGNCKLPKFKQRKDKISYSTSFVNNNIRIQDKKIRLPKVGFVKVRGLRPIPNNSKIKKAIVFKSKSGKYYISLVVQTYENNLNTKINKPNLAIGLDFKIGDIFISNNNFIPKYSNHYFKLLDKISILQKKTNRKKRFSNNYWKSTNLLRNLHRKIVNIRNDLLNKISYFLAKNFKYVIIEDLSITEIVKKLGKGKNAYNTSFYKFVKKLIYKMGKNVVKINKWFPSSKTCSKCGKKKKHLKLSQRTYNCAYCGLSINRDINAAINILNEGLRILNIT